MTTHKMYVAPDGDEGGEAELDVQEQIGVMPAEEAIVEVANAANTSCHRKAMIGIFTALVLMSVGFFVVPYDAALGDLATFRDTVISSTLRFTNVSYGYMPKSAPVLLYCPKKNELTADYNAHNVKLNNRGWKVTGGGRASSKATFNLLGGFIEFKMDISKTNLGQQVSGKQLNVNLYTVFPRGSGAYNGEKQYCDINSNPWCVEMDIIEANAFAAWATTWHTTPKPKSGYHPGEKDPCNPWGCAKVNYFKNSKAKCKAVPNKDKKIDSTKPFTVRAEFDHCGEMKVTLKQGNAKKAVGPLPLYPPATVATLREVVKAMTERGAAVESSQWLGWAPGDMCANGTNPHPLASSVFKVSKLKIKGSIVRGTASLCDDGESFLV